MGDSETNKKIRSMYLTKLPGQYSGNDIIDYRNIPGINHIRQKIDNSIIKFFVGSSRMGLASGVLLCGVSGSGRKTLLKGISKEYKLGFISADCDSPLSIRETFYNARSVKPCIIHFDNLDKITEHNILAQIASCMLDKKKGIIVIGSCLSKELLDEGLVRFGCFEICIEMGIPNKLQRIDIIAQYLNSSNITVLSDTIESMASSLPGQLANGIRRILRQFINEFQPEEWTGERFREFVKLERIHCSNITFDDIGGMDRIKDELVMLVINPILFSEKYLQLGIKKPFGVLMVGESGCGKTMLAQAISSMSCCNFISVRGPELLDKYVGETERNIRSLFAKAKNMEPCIIFFDELECICKTRSVNQQGSVVQQLLTVIDGFSTRGNVYIIGATNRLSDIDSALLRPGRFDKIVHVTLDDSDRRKILNRCLNEVPIEEGAELVDISTLTGAQISGAVKTACLEYLRDHFDNEDPLLVKLDYLERAVNDVKGKP